MSDERFIPYGTQSIDDSDLRAIEAVLRSDWLTQGPAIERFEQSLCALTNAGDAVATSNATAALHIACLALDVGPGDKVWTSANSFVASANCALYCGAQVDFVDIDPISFNMSVEALDAKLLDAASAGALPKVVIPVHFAGQSCDMKAIGALSKRFGFRVIEDASHAVGGRYLGSMVGACQYSDITVFSFHPVKIVTTAEGGAALTNDSELAGRLRLLRSHGITRDPDLMDSPSQGAWYYQQTTLGYNYRMTDMQAALGASQLTRIEAFLDRRHAIADTYDQLLDGLPIRRPVRLANGRSALHLYVIQVDDESRRKVVFDSLRADGIGVNVHYIPIHLQPYYRALGFREGQFPFAEAYYRRAISLPMHPKLSSDDVQRVVRSLETSLS